MRAKRKTINVRDVQWSDVDVGGFLQTTFELTFHTEKMKLVLHLNELDLREIAAHLWAVIRDREERVEKHKKMMHDE